MLYYLYFYYTLSLEKAIDYTDIEKIEVIFWKTFKFYDSFFNAFLAIGAIFFDIIFFVLQ
jgi:hypothetical protein